MTVVNSPETDMPSWSMVEDPALLQGEALLDFIASNGLCYVVSSNPLGADTVLDVEKRLGNLLSQVDVRFEGHPNDVDCLVARFVMRETTVSDLA